MKQHTGDEIRTIMAEMPMAAVEALQAAYPKHGITEREARWWGYLMYARSESYEGTEFTMPVGTTGDEWTQRFLDYVLADRASLERNRLVKRPWPDLGMDRL